MLQLKKEMRSVKKCLAAAFSLLVSLSLAAQEVEHINYDDYYWGVGKTTKEAIADLKSKVNDVVTVAVKTTLKTSNGKQTYDSSTGTEAYFTLPESGITLIPMEGYWRAGIEKEKVKHIDGNWVEQNITINNTYNEAPTYSRGFQRNTSTTTTTRRTDVVGPSGRVVNSSPGKTTTTKTKRNWNGRYGYTWKRSKTE